MKVDIPEHFTQKNFENKINEIGIENITYLNVEYNENIEKIPYLPNLKKLSC